MDDKIKAPEAKTNDAPKTINKDGLKLFTCTDHDSHCIGVASIVVADSEAQARDLLDAALIEQGLKPYELEAYTLTDVDQTTAQAMVLRNGDY